MDAAVFKGLGRDLNDLAFDFLLNAPAVLKADHVKLDILLAIDSQEELN